MTTYSCPQDTYYKYKHYFVNETLSACEINKKILKAELFWSYCNLVSFLFCNFVGMNNTTINLDSDYLTCFVKNEIDEQWLKSIKNSVAPWVKSKGKSYWDVVLFASVQKGILNNISRLKFAELILHLCPEEFEKDETAQKIRSAMEKCPRTSWKKKENYGKPEGDRILKDLVEDVSRLLEREADIPAYVQRFPSSTMLPKDLWTRRNILLLRPLCFSTMR